MPFIENVAKPVEDNSQQKSHHAEAQCYGGGVRIFWDRVSHYCKTYDYEKTSDASSCITVMSLEISELEVFLFEATS